MIELRSMALRMQKENLLVLDQQELPQREIWLECDGSVEMANYIRQLKVRGAPLIGVAAVCSLAQDALRGKDFLSLKRNAEDLVQARPTAVNLKTCVDELMSCWSAENYNVEGFCQNAWQIFENDVRLCDRMATYGAELIEDRDFILTHCNTGGLATAGVGTALGVIRKAHEQGKLIQVWVDETRPLLQGARLTAWELKHLNIPYTLICDNMSGSLMKKRQVSKVFVGADRITTNGDFANKVGTYNLAVLCRHHDIPFYVVAPWTTVDFTSHTGNQIPIEERSPAEVRGYVRPQAEIDWSPEACQVYNPSFDVTESELVTAYVLDTGVLTPNQFRAECERRKKFETVESESM